MRYLKTLMRHHPLLYQGFTLVSFYVYVYSMISTIMYTCCLLNINYGRDRINMQKKREHTPLITSLHLALSCASFSSCYHSYPLFSISSPSLSEHFSGRCFNCTLLGLSPCWFHWIACQVIEVLSFLNVSQTLQTFVQ